VKRGFGFVIVECGFAWFGFEMFLLGGCDGVVGPPSCVIWYLFGGAASLCVCWVRARRKWMGQWDFLV